MSQSQQEKRQQALARILATEIDKATRDNFYGKLIIEIRAGNPEIVRTEQTRRLADELGRD